MVKSSLTQTLPCVTSPRCIYGGLILRAWCWCKIWLWMTFPCGSSCRGWQTSNRFNIITPQHHNRAIITTLCCKYVQRVCTCVNLTANSTLVNMVLWTGLINKRVNIKSIMRLHNPFFFYSSSFTILWIHLVHVKRIIMKACLFVNFCFYFKW